MRKIALITISVLFLAGCTSVKVNKVDQSHNINKICIEKNDAVIFSEFLSSVKNRIEYHGIKTVVFRKYNEPENCEYTLWYTALRSWDVSPYLSHAELVLYRNKAVIGEATYHLKAGGGLSLTKWASVSTKMNPVVDELLNKKR